MLQAFREHKRWLMVIAMVFIIPSFVVTGIYSYNRMTQSDNSIVKVGEGSITPENFDLAKRQQLERLRQQMGESFHASLLDTPQAREDLLRMLMDEAAINQVVAKNHISVSEAQAVALIKNADALKVDGKFSAERYEQFLRSQGKSDQQFVMEIRNDLAKEAVVSGVRPIRSPRRLRSSSTRSSPKSAAFARWFCLRMTTWTRLPLRTKRLKPTTTLT